MIDGLFKHSHESQGVSQIDMPLPIIGLDSKRLAIPSLLNQRESEVIASQPVVSCHVDRMCEQRNTVLPMASLHMRV